MAWCLVLFAKNLCIALILVCSWSAPSWSLPCDVAEKLRHSSIMENDEFWKEFAKVADDDEKIRSLVERHYRGSPRPSTNTSSAPGLLQKPAFRTSRQAIKDLEVVPRHIRAKYDEFLTYAQRGESGLRELNSTSGGWNFKRLTPSNNYSVRLSKGYRVLMEKLPDGSFTVLNVDIHSAH
jgi:hypothetical protein